jgi:ADP-ribose pyrophosphatase YjhB (NUDIX family)
MKFCSDCASPVFLSIPLGDNRPRFVCTVCKAIHYQNPRLVVGSIPIWERDGQLQILLCKRAIQPRLGFWTLPAGFMENGESTDEAAMRETIEEAGAHIELKGLFTLLNVPHVNQVHLFYRANLLDLDYAAGEESLEVKLFTEQEIPWDELAFPTTIHTLRYFLADYSTLKTGGNFDLHTMTCTQRAIFNQGTLPSAPP